MFELTELEERVLSVLEEAGEENIPTLINTIFLGAGSREGLEAYLATLRSLVDKNLVRLSTSRGLDRRLADLSQDSSVLEIAGQVAKLKFDEAVLYWKDASRAGPPYGETYPYVVLTDRGKVKSQEILLERGYQWWSPIA